MNWFKFNRSQFMLSEYSRYAPKLQSKYRPCILHHNYRELYFLPSIYSHNIPSRKHLLLPVMLHLTKVKTYSYFFAGEQPYYQKKNYRTYRCRDQAAQHIIRRESHKPEKPSAQYAADHSYDQIHDQPRTRSFNYQTSKPAGKKPYKNIPQPIHTKEFNRFFTCLFLSKTNSTFVP